MSERHSAGVAAAGLGTGATAGSNEIEAGVVLLLSRSSPDEDVFSVHDRGRADTFHYRWEFHVEARGFSLGLLYYMK